MKRMVALLMLLSACATLTEEEKEARQMALAEARDEYMMKAAQCRKAGGFMYVERRGPSRISTSKDPTRGWTIHDYRWAQCVR